MPKFKSKFDKLTLKWSDLFRVADKDDMTVESAPAINLQQPQKHSRLSEGEKSDEAETDELIGQLCRYEIVRRVEEEIIERIKGFMVKPKPKPEEYSADWFLAEDYEKQQKIPEQTTSFRPFYLPLKIPFELNRFVVQAVHGWQAKTLLNNDLRIGSLYHGKDNHKIADYSFEDPANPRVGILVAVNNQGEFDEVTTLKRIRPIMLAAEEQIKRYVDNLNDKNPAERIAKRVEIEKLIQPADVNPPKETPAQPPLKTKVSFMEAGAKKTSQEVEDLKKAA